MFLKFDRQYWSLTRKTVNFSEIKDHQSTRKYSKTFS